MSNCVYEFSSLNSTSIMRPSLTYFWPSRRRKLEPKKEGRRPLTFEAINSGRMQLVLSSLCKALSTSFIRFRASFNRSSRSVTRTTNSYKSLIVYLRTTNVVPAQRVLLPEISDRARTHSSSSEHLNRRAERTKGWI